MHLVQDEDLKATFRLCKDVYEAASNNPPKDQEKIHVFSRSCETMGPLRATINQLVKNEPLRTQAALNLACAIEIKGLRYSDNWTQRLVTPVLQVLQDSLKEMTRNDDKLVSLVERFNRKFQDYTTIAREDERIFKERGPIMVDGVNDMSERSCYFIYRAGGKAQKIMLPLNPTHLNIDMEKLQASTAWIKLSRANYKEDIERDSLLFGLIVDLDNISSQPRTQRHISEKIQQGKEEEEKQECKNQVQEKKIDENLLSRQTKDSIEVTLPYKKLAVKSITSNNTEDQERIISELLDEISYKDFSGESLSTIQTKTIELNKCLEQIFALSGEIAKLEALGKGKSGEVSRFFHTSLRKFLAEKSVLPRDNSDMKYDKAMIQEMKNLLKVRKENSQNLLQVYKIEYEPNRSLKLLMEYGIGTLQDVFDYIKDAKIVYPELAEDIKKAIQSQLDFLKDNDILYTDIHAQNVIIREDSSFIFCDYEAAISMCIGAGGSVAELTKRLESEAQEYVNISEKKSKEIFFAKFITDRAWQIYKRLDSEIARNNMNRLFVDLVLLEELKPRLHKELEEINQEQKGLLSGEQKSNLDCRKFYCLKLLGSTYTSLKDYKNSLKCFAQAKDIGESISGVDPALTRALIDMSMGDIYHRLQRFEDALNHYLQINIILDEIPRYNLDEDQKGMIKMHQAVAFLKIGDCYQTHERKQEAREYFTKSKELFSDLKYEENVCDLDFQLISLEENPDKLEDYIKSCKSKNQLVNRHGLQYYQELVRVYAFQGNRQKFEKASQELSSIFADVFEGSPDLMLETKEFLSKVDEITTLKETVVNNIKIEELYKDKNQPIGLDLPKCYEELARAYLELHEMEKVDEYMKKLSKIAQISHEASDALKRLQEEKDTKVLSVLNQRINNLNQMLKLGNLDQLRMSCIRFELFLNKAQVQILRKDKAKFGKLYNKADKELQSIYSAPGDPNQLGIKHLVEGFSLLCREAVKHEFL